MQHLDEGTIHAWLDGALSADEARDAEAHVASCAECQAAVAEARGLIAAASRILTALDDVPGGVIPAGAASPSGQGSTVDSLAAFRQRRDRGRRRWFTSARIAAAAVVVLAAGTFTVMQRAGSDASFAVSSDTAAPLPATAPVAASEPAPLIVPTPAPQENRAAGVASERRVASAETDEAKDAAKKADARERQAEGASSRLADGLRASVTAAPTDSQPKLLQKAERDSARADVATRARSGITAGATLASETERLRKEAAAATAIPAPAPPPSVAPQRAQQQFAPAPAAKAAATSANASTIPPSAYVGCYDITVGPATVVGGREDPFASMPRRLALDTTIVRSDSVGVHRLARVVDPNVVGSSDAADKVERLPDGTWMPVEAAVGTVHGEGIRFQLERGRTVLSALLIARNGELRGTIGQIGPSAGVVLGVPIVARRAVCTTR